MAPISTRQVQDYHQYLYSGADKSLARPRRTQAATTEGFDFHVSYL